MSHKTQVSELAAAVKNFANSSGEGLVADAEEAAKLLLVWLEHLRKFGTTKVADELLDASAAAIREAAAMLAIGAVRPCLFSLRAQIDLVLGWVYFKDHKVEYELVNRTGEGFKLKKEILNYLKESFPGYGERMAILLNIKKRIENDPYRLLSAHIHAQSGYVVPGVYDLKDVVSSLARAKECISLQSDVAEYLSDHLFCAGIASGASLPSEIKDSILKRSPTAGQRVVLFQ